MGRHVPPRLGTCHLSMLIVVLLHIVLVYLSYSEFWILNYDKWSSEFWILARVKIVLFVIRILLFMTIVMNSLFCDWCRRSDRNDHCRKIVPFIQAGLSHIVFSGCFVFYLNTLLYWKWCDAHNNISHFSEQWNL